MANNEEHNYFTEFLSNTNLFQVLMDDLLSESQRGAVLIGMEYVSEHLKELVVEIMPHESNKKQKELLNFSGLLGTFGAKIELCYAFRIIDHTIYESLKAIQRLRNQAAHSNKNFDLADDRYKQEFDKFLNMGQGFRPMIKDIAPRTLGRIKVENVVYALREQGLSDDEIKKYFDNYEVTQEMEELFQTQRLHWELLFGVVMICANLFHIKNSLKEQLKESTTWSSAIRKVSIDQSI